ncbi:MAG: hypothetical protein CMJ77_14205 [Planctomycetaceae bacterium]|nr:hypothetical protein [Planctomycetaceae bacterium]
MEEKLTRAKTYYKNGMASDALDILSEHLEEHPNDAASLELQGLILHSFQEYQRARQSIETAASIKALSPSAQLALADSYWFTEERSLATKLFNQLSRCDTLPSHLLPAIAIGLGRAQSFHAAIEVCRRSVDSDPTGHQARYGVAFYMAKAGYPPEFVLAIMKTLVDIMPSVFHYRNAMATLLCQLNDPDRAYLAVADASFVEIDTVTCPCCLERLTSLFDRGGDMKKSDYCHERSLIMRSDDQGGQFC